MEQERRETQNFYLWIFAEDRGIKPIFSEVVGCNFTDVDVNSRCADGRDIYEGELGSGFQSIRGTHRVGVVIQIPGEDPDGNIQQLAGGGQKPQEGKAKLGTAVQGSYQGGRRPKGVTGVLHCRDTGYFSLLVGYMGADSEDGEGPG